MIPRPRLRRRARRPGADVAVRPSVAFLIWRDTANPEGGGSELFVERIAEELAADGWDVTICAASYEGAPRDEWRRGVHVRRRGHRLSVYLHGLAYLLTRAGRRTRFVVDVQNGIPFFSPLVRRHGIVNLVHHVHKEQWEIIFPGTQARIGWWIESTLAPWLYRKHAYVTVSDATRRELIGLGIAGDRISIVHNGLDVPPAGPHTPSRAEAPTICVLGRLVPHKQVEHALNAAAAARATLPDLRVEVVGEGWWHQALVDHVHARGLTDVVTFHGHLSDADRDAVLDRSWVLLAPSVKEGWGIAIMEAAAHGVPAIAYRAAGGVCESIIDGETGWLVDDPSELEKRAEEMLRDSTLRQGMSDSARAQAVRYDWTTSAHRFAEVLHAARRG